MENKKIINANPLDFDGISFKSKLEVSIYKKLKEEGLPVAYEPNKYVLVTGFKPTVPFYTKDKKTGGLKLNNKKLIDITYTPDFVISLQNITIIIEAKGFENDVFPVKKKLFRKLLEQEEDKYIFFEIFTIRQLKQAIEIINDYVKQDKTIDT